MCVDAMRFKVCPASREAVVAHPRLALGDVVASFFRDMDVFLHSLGCLYCGLIVQYRSGWFITKKTYMLLYIHKNHLIQQRFIVYGVAPGEYCPVRAVHDPAVL